MKDMKTTNTELIDTAVITLKEAGKQAPEITGLPTGVEGLDELFFTSKLVKGEPVKQPLGGYPSGAVINITGISDTGKTLMAEQFAVKQASQNKPVCFITVESPAPFVAASLKERAAAMGVKYEDIEDNIILVDAATHAQLRDDLLTLFSTLAHVYREYGAKITIVDSVTGFFEEREMLARAVVRKLFNFMKKWHQTALFISQKRSGHEELSAEAAGGYAVAHIVDCSIVLSKVTITSKYQESMYRKPMGEVVRLFRIDGCRLCGHDTSTRVMEITEKGLVRIGPSLSELTNQQGGGAHD